MSTIPTSLSCLHSLHFIALSLYLFVVAYLTPPALILFRVKPSVTDRTPHLIPRIHFNHHPRPLPRSLPLQPLWLQTTRHRPEPMPDSSRPATEARTHSSNPNTSPRTQPQPNRYRPTKGKKTPAQATKAREWQRLPAQTSPKVSGSSLEPRLRK